MIIGGKQHNLREEGKRILLVVVFAFHTGKIVFQIAVIKITVIDALNPFPLIIGRLIPSPH